MTQLMASSCPSSRQTKVENIRPGTVFMFVDKSGNVVQAKEYDEHEKNCKEAKRPNNPSMRKCSTQSSKSYTASVQQRALQIVKDSTKRISPQAEGLQKVSEKKIAPYVDGTFRIASGKSYPVNVNGNKKDTSQKAGSIKKSAQKYMCQEQSGIGRIQSRGQPYQREAQKKALTKAQLDRADEKALVKAKPKRSKTKPSFHRKGSTRSTLENLTPPKDNNDGVWFECNVPFRVKIPFPICTQKLFGTMPLPAGISMNSSTISKGKPIVEAGQGRKVGCPPSYGSICIAMIPANSPNTSLGQSASYELEDPKETSGKPKKLTEKRLKGVKRCSVCETCTQTGYNMDEEALSNPLLSCLEQICQHLSSENGNAQKREKCECRYFAEKSTSVRSVDNTAKDNAAPNASATPTNVKTKTPLKTQKIKPQKRFNRRNSVDKPYFKNKDKPNELLGATTDRADMAKDSTNVECMGGRMEPSICYNRYPHCPRAMVYRCMRGCTASLCKPCTMLPPPESGKLEAREPKKSISDILRSDVRRSENFSVTRVSESQEKMNSSFESQQQYQDEGVSNPLEQDDPDLEVKPDSEEENPLPTTLPNNLPRDQSEDATSDDSRNSDRKNNRCCTVCRPEGGVSDTQWNDKNTERTIRNQDRLCKDRSHGSSHGSYMDKSILVDSKSQQTEERLDFDNFRLPGMAQENDEYPRRKSVTMNDGKAKENRIKQRSQSAPANIKYSCSGSQCNSEPSRIVRPYNDLRSGNAPQAEMTNVGRQVSGRSEEDVYATGISTNMEIFENKIGSRQQKQPLVLVPFRVENRNSGQTLAMCKANEWRKLTLTNVTKVTPKQLRIVSGYSNRAPSGSSRVPRASPPSARAVPRKTSQPAQLRPSQRQGQAQLRTYPSSGLRCPRHPNGPPSNRNARSSVACNRCTRTAAAKPPPRSTWRSQFESRDILPTRGNHQQSTSANSFALNGSRPEYSGSRQPTIPAIRSNNPGTSAIPLDCSSQREINASIAISCESNCTAGPSAKFQTPAGSEQTLTDQPQCPRCLAACKPQCHNKRSIETVTLMQPRQLRSDESLQSDSYDDQGARAMEEPLLDSKTENQRQSGFGLPSCHFECLQYGAVPPVRNQNSSMGDFARSQQEFQMGMGYQSQPHSYTCTQQSCAGSVCSNSTGLMDPRDFLPTVSAPHQPNQMPMGVYQSYQSEQSYHQVQCQQSNDIYGNQYGSFYRPEDLKESIRSMPMGFYEQTINKYKINPLDSNFRPPSLGSSFFQQLEQFNQQQQQSAAVYGFCNHHCPHQQQPYQSPHGSSACSCPYIMSQNPFPQQQQPQQETQFKNFDQTEI